MSLLALSIMYIQLGISYKQVYGINLHEMQIQLSLGKSLDYLADENKARLEDPGLVGSLGFITILIGASDDGISTDEIVDFDAANKIIK